MIPFLNQWGGVWFKYFSLVLIQNTIFLGFVFLALYLLRNASARVKYYISIIGLIKLILPPFLPAPFLQNSYTPAIIQKYSISVEQLIPLGGQYIFPQVILSSFGFLFLIWLIISSLFLLVPVAATLKLKRNLNRSNPVLVKNSEVYFPKIKIFRTSAINMPLSIGFFPSKIFVPKYWEKYSSDCRQMILYHEFAHLKRKDSIIQFTQIIVQALYFFHPLVWLLNNQLNKYREMACDDFSIYSKDCSSFEYSQLLAELAEKIIKSRPKYSSASAMIKQRNELLKRVQYQMKEAAMKRFSKKKIPLKFPH